MYSIKHKNPKRELTSTILFIINMIQGATAEVNAFDLWASLIKYSQCASDKRAWPAASKQTNKHNWMHGLSWSISSQILFLSLLNKFVELFRWKLKMVACSTSRPYYGKWCGWGPCLQYHNVRDSDYFTWNHSRWDFWLDMLFCTTPVPFLLPLIRRLWHAQVFTIKQTWIQGHGAVVHPGVEVVAASPHTPILHFFPYHFYPRH